MKIQQILSCLLIHFLQARRSHRIQGFRVCGAGFLAAVPARQVTKLWSFVGMHVPTHNIQ